MPSSIQEVAFRTVTKRLQVSSEIQRHREVNEDIEPDADQKTGQTKKKDKPCRSAQHVSASTQCALIAAIEPT